MKHACRMMLLSIFIFWNFAAIATSTSSLDREIDLKWEDYKKFNRRIYEPEEEVLRKRMFHLTHLFIENHNQNDSKYFVTAHNQFSDMSPEERQQFLGLSPNKELAERKWTPGVADRRLPPILDYRSDRCLQPVKFQAGCGGCWAFTAITPIEFNRCKLTGWPVKLSEQQLLDCDPFNNGCSGGWFDDAWRYLKDGSNLAQLYGPYRAKEGKCMAQKSFNRAQVVSYEWIDPNPIVMMKALQEGPLAVAFQVTDSFYHYKEGIYLALSCRQTVNHSVVIVGYGSLFGIPYWIGRNSWGASWGSGGYFFIMRGVNMCNIEKYPAKVTVQAG